MFPGYSSSYATKFQWIHKKMNWTGFGYWWIWSSCVPLFIWLPHQRFVHTFDQWWKKNDDIHMSTCAHVWWIRTSFLPHLWKRVWKCRRWSRPAQGTERCTGHTLDVTKPGEHMPYLEHAHTANYLHNNVCLPKTVFYSQMRFKIRFLSSRACVPLASFYEWLYPSVFLRCWTLFLRSSVHALYNSTGQ